MKPINCRNTEIIYSDKKLIKGLSEKEIADIKEALTFKNPKYEDIKKFSKYGYTNEPPYLFLYSLKKDGIEVPLGFNELPISLNTKHTDKRIEALVKFPDFVLNLRDSQKDASEDFLNNNLTEEIYGCIKLPTGKGKSILGAYLSYVLKQKTLIVVHKTDLVDGWIEDIKLAFNYQADIGIIKAKSNKIGKHFTIATVQTLVRKSPEELEKLFNTFGFIIQDEMHHCPSSTFEVVNRFKARYRLGLTATPERADGLAFIMKLYFGEFCYLYPEENILNDTDILPVKVITKNIQGELNTIFEKHTVTKKGKDIDVYTLKQLHYPKGIGIPKNCVYSNQVPYNSRPKIPSSSVDKYVNENYLLPILVEDVINEFKLGRSCLVFFIHKEQCETLREKLKEKGISEENIGLYYGDNKSKVNNEIKQKAETTRKYITISTYSKATEGTNVPQWEVVFLAGSLNNGKSVEQAIGRVRRVFNKPKINPVLVYDYRYPNIRNLMSHAKTRNTRYSKLGFEVSRQTKNNIRDIFYKRGK